jgi:hypothetical protein
LAGWCRLARDVLSDRGIAEGFGVEILGAYVHTFRYPRDSSSFKA